MNLEEISGRELVDKLMIRMKARNDQLLKRYQKLSRVFNTNPDRWQYKLTTKTIDQMRQISGAISILSKYTNTPINK